MFLKQSTAVDVLVGPFVDATDAYTAETGLTLAIKVSKNGQTMATKNDATTPTHDADGYYNCELDATDTNTVGTLVLTQAGSATHLAWSKTYYVLEEAIYDAIFGASAAAFDANARVDVGSLAGTAQTARDIGASVLLSSGTGTGQVSLSSGSVTAGTVSDKTGYSVSSVSDKTGYRLSSTGVGDIWDESSADHVAAGSMGAAMYIARSSTAQAGAASTITLDASSSSTDDFYNNGWIFIVSGTGVGQGNTISDYNGTTKVATVQDSWATNPSSDSVFVIMPRGGLPGASAPTAAAVADAVWDEASADHTSEGTFGAQFQASHEGTAQAATGTTFTLDATGSSSTDDFYNYGFIRVIAGTGAGQTRQISGYVGSSKVATVSLAWTTTPSTDSQYVLIADGIDAATIAQIADGVWDEGRSGHVSAGSFGEYVLADTTRVSGSTSAADGLEAAVSGSTPLPADVQQVGSVAEDLPTATAMATIDSNVDAILVDTGTTLNDKLDVIDGIVDAILLDTAEIGAAGAGLTDLGGMSTGMQGEVNAQVLDVLNVDTFAESSGVPAATASLVDKIAFLTTLARNKITQTASTQTLRNDADSGNIATSTQSDDATTYTKGEWT
ncbi:MAG: hypothetical protein ACPG6R_11875 [Aequoribacter sp.]|uniref:hypothetical protein n=1 Tax=Aequoribacter sp. TaxID=2847771 RepID=UPI003C3CFD94